MQKSQLFLLPSFLPFFLSPTEWSPRRGAPRRDGRESPYRALEFPSTCACAYECTYAKGRKACKSISEGWVGTWKAGRQVRQWKSKEGSRRASELAAHVTHRRGESSSPYSRSDCIGCSYWKEGSSWHNNCISRPASILAAITPFNNALVPSLPFCIRKCKRTDPFVVAGAFPTIRPAG